MLEYIRLHGVTSRPGFHAGMCRRDKFHPRGDEKYFISYDIHQGNKNVSPPLVAICDNEHAPSFYRRKTHVFRVRTF